MRLLLPLLLSACAPAPISEPAELPAPARSDAIPPSRVPVEPPPVEPIAGLDTRALELLGNRSEPRPLVTEGVPETSATADRDAIASVVKRSQGRIQTCLEQSLRANPSVNGKVSAGWTIIDGRVTESHLVANTTGDDALGVCITRSVRAFRFDHTISAEVAEFPWIVSGA